MAILIKKEWEGTADQRAVSDDGVTWSVAELIAESKGLPVMDIPLEHLYIGQTICGIPIRRFVAHMKAVLESDLSYPIILDDEGWIFDGAHRVAKALIESKDTIKAVRFEKNPIPMIEVDK